MMSLDQVEILVKGINIDRSEQYRFIKERFENGACLLKNQTISLHHDPENNKIFTPSSTQISFPTNMHLMPVAQSPIQSLQSLQSTSCLTLQNSVKIENSVPLQVHKLHICSPGESQSDSFEAFVTAGIVTDKTRFCFRSKSASSYLVIQISRETWQADQHGVLQSERLLDFIKELFMKWKEKQVNHKLRIILFSRTLLSNIRDPSGKIQTGYKTLEPHLVKIDNKKLREKLYDNTDLFDTYEEINGFWQHNPDKIMSTIRSKLINWPSKIKSSLETIMGDTKVGPDFKSEISLSINGNLLEAANLCLKQFQNDRISTNIDFNHLGHQIICVTPGQGYFEVPEYLANTVKNNMVDIGSGCDLVCLGVQPLHAVPLLYCVDCVEKETTMKWRYEIANWVWTSFYIDRLHDDAHTSNVRHYPRTQIDGFANLGYNNEIKFKSDETFRPLKRPSILETSTHETLDQLFDDRFIEQLVQKRTSTKSGRNNSETHSHHSRSTQNSRLGDLPQIFDFNTQNIGTNSFENKIASSPLATTKIQSFHTDNTPDNDDGIEASRVRGSGRGGYGSSTSEDEYDQSDAQVFSKKYKQTLMHKFIKREDRIAKNYKSPVSANHRRSNTYSSYTNVSEIKDFLSPDLNKVAEGGSFVPANLVIRPNNYASNGSKPAVGIQINKFSYQKTPYPIVTTTGLTKSLEPQEISGPKSPFVVQSICGSQFGQSGSFTGFNAHDQIRNSAQKQSKKFIQKQVNPLQSNRNRQFSTKSVEHSNLTKSWTVISNNPPELNPFDSHINNLTNDDACTSRWAHSFPKYLDGLVVYPHVIGQNPYQEYIRRTSVDDNFASEIKLKQLCRKLKALNRKKEEGFEGPDSPAKFEITRDSAKSEEAFIADSWWDLEMFILVDWNSLVYPAGLPLTTNYFKPEFKKDTELALANDKFGKDKAYLKMLIELRLRSGFQIMVNEDLENQRDSASYSEDCGTKDDFRKEDFRKEDFRKEDFRKEDFRKDDFRKDDFRKDEFKDYNSIPVEPELDTSCMLSFNNNVHILDLKEVHNGQGNLSFQQAYSGKNLIEPVVSPYDSYTYNIITDNMVCYQNHSMEVVSWQTSGKVNWECDVVDVCGELFHYAQFCLKLNAVDKTERVQYLVNFLNALNSTKRSVDGREFQYKACTRNVLKRKEIDKRVFSLPGFAERSFVETDTLSEFGKFEQNVFEKIEKNLIFEQTRESMENNEIDLYVIGEFKMYISMDILNIVEEKIRCALEKLGQSENHPKTATKMIAKRFFESFAANKKVFKVFGHSHSSIFGYVFYSLEKITVPVGRDGRIPAIFEVEFTDANSPFQMPTQTQNSDPVSFQTADLTTTGLSFDGQQKTEEPLSIKMSLPNRININYLVYFRISSYKIGDLAISKWIKELAKDINADEKCIFQRQESSQVELTTPHFGKHVVTISPIQPPHYLQLFDRDKREQHVYKSETFFSLVEDIKLPDEQFCNEYLKSNRFKRIETGVAGGVIFSLLQLDPYLWIDVFRNRSNDMYELKIFHGVI